MSGHEQCANCETLIAVSVVNKTSFYARMLRPASKLNLIISVLRYRNQYVLPFSALHKPNSAKQNARPQLAWSGLERKLDSTDYIM